MDRAGKKVRDISYHSPKTGGMVVVHSEAARAYSKYLEERPEVASYEACKPLDGTRLNKRQTSGASISRPNGPATFASALLTAPPASGSWSARPT